MQPLRHKIADISKQANHLNLFILKILMLLLGLMISGFITKSNCQTVDTTVQNKDAILNEIRVGDMVVAHYFPLGEKANEVFGKMKLAGAVTFLNDTSYPIKYYAFYRMMEINDSLAYKYLRAHINDTTTIYESASCMNADEKFNEKIAFVYKWFVENKYSGRCFGRNGHVYCFNNRDRKTQKQRLKEVKSLLAANNIKLEKRY